MSLAVQATVVMSTTKLNQFQSAQTAITYFIEILNSKLFPLKKKIKEI